MILARQISEMDVGEKGWTVEWASTIDAESRYWINGKYGVTHEPVLFINEILVERKADGWHVTDFREGMKQEIKPYKEEAGGWILLRSWLGGE